MTDPGFLALFVVATFLGALVAGLAGFAFGLIVQGYAVWKLRHALDWRRLLPMMIGGQFGIPLGVELLRWLPAADMRAAIGVVLVVFSLYSLLRPKLRPMTDAGRLGDGIAGVASGIVGGATGLAGILPTIWASLRGWTKDEQRAVFQPVAVAIFVGCLLWLGGTGSFDRPTLLLFLAGLPALLAGTWAGLRLYGRLDEAGFRKVILALLLLAGVALVAPLIHLTY
jgi:uncharacterized membrane protein YfcA